MLAQTAMPGFVPSANFYGCVDRDLLPSESVSLNGPADFENGFRLPGAIGLMQMQQQQQQQQMGQGQGQMKNQPAPLLQNRPTDPVCTIPGQRWS